MTESLPAKGEKLACIHKCLFRVYG